MPYTTANPNYYYNSCTQCGQSYYNFDRHICPLRPPPASKKCSTPNCHCKVPTSSRRQNSHGRKRKKEEKENIDPETLAKYKAMEWEQRMGYWCQRCKIRFPNSDALVDHMAKNKHKDPKA